MKIAILPLIALLVSVAAGAAERPNIILIMVDDMGFSDLGYHGGEIDTPNLDSLARGGVRFSQFYNSGRCCPTRATLMTGLHPHQTGIGWMTQRANSDRGKDAPPAYQGYLNRKCVTIGEVLKEQGYATMMAGKWHLGSGAKDRWPLQRGFDRYYGCFAGALRLFHPDHPRGITFGNNPIKEPESTTDEAFYTTDAFTDYAIRFLKEEFADQNRPAFLYLAYNAPHWPLQAFEDDIAKYRGKYKIGWDELRTRRYRRQIELGLIDPTWKLSPRTPGIPAWETLDNKQQDAMDLKMAVYAAMIDRIDQNIGKLVAFLKETGVYENTLILFLSDNGGCQEGGMLGRGEFYDIQKRNLEVSNSYGEAWANASNTPFRLYKHFAHEGGAATPFFMHWPARIKPHQRWYDQPAQLIDVMPTILDIADADYPKTAHGNGIPPLDGLSLRPAMDAKPLGRAKPIFIEHENNAFVRDDDWKLVGRAVAAQDGVDRSKWELYDMASDRTETNNLAAERPKVMSELAGKWDRWADRVGVYPKGKIRKRKAKVITPKIVLRTKWGGKVTAENVWQQYPRPTLKRNNWTNLNGHWDFAVTAKTAEEVPPKWDGKILVPFAIEAPLSGVGKRLEPDDAIWYRRTIQIDRKIGCRYRLNFEAVDYQSTVWVNGQTIGSHTGGNLPFSFDMTDALVDGENRITLRVTDATDSKGAYQLHGKQRLKPQRIWYTPVSGIWQTVWMEEVPEVHIAALKITPRINGRVLIDIKTIGLVPDDLKATVTATLDGKIVARATGSPESVELDIPDPTLWSPSSPTLYELRIELGEDVVDSYVGLREVGRRRDSDGHWRFTLNGEEFFHWGTLDQGWWPDGLLTPPSDDALRSDIEFLKAAGFNTIRKHIKVEPRRFYYHCDRIGMTVWQDQVSSMSDNPKWTRLRPNPQTRDWPVAAHRQFMIELQGMIDSLYSHPCIVQWVPFNERWGQHQTMEVGKWILDYDSTRLINIASGGNFFPVGHIVDYHQYPHPGFRFDLDIGGRFDDYIKVVGEFGGHGFPIQGHLWGSNKQNWGYGRLPKNKGEWRERYRKSINMLADLKRQGIAAGIYTQTTDVEGEINGLITYDRKVQKISPEKLAEIHREAGLTE